MVAGDKPQRVKSTRRQVADLWGNHMGALAVPLGPQGTSPVPLGAWYFPCNLPNPVAVLSATLCMLAVAIAGATVHS